MGMLPIRWVVHALLRPVKRFYLRWLGRFYGTRAGWCLAGPVTVGLLNAFLGFSPSGSRTPINDLVVQRWRGRGLQGVASPAEELKQSNGLL